MDDQFFLANLDQAIYDGSCVKDFMFCMRHGYFRWVVGYVPSIPSVHLSWGAALHHAIEAAHLGLTENDCVQLAIDLTKELPEHKTKNAESASRAMRKYFQFIQTERGRTVEYHINERTVKKALEVEFDFNVTPNIVYSGRMDRIIERNDMIYVEDYKTTSMRSSNWSLEWENNFSLLGYCNATTKIVGTCSGVIVTLFHILTGSVGIEQEVVVNWNKERQMKYEDQLHIWCEKIYNAYQQYLNYPELAYTIYPMSNCDKTCVHKYGFCPYYRVCVYGEEVAEQTGLVIEEPKRKE